MQNELENKKIHTYTVRFPIGESVTVQADEVADSGKNNEWTQFHREGQVVARYRSDQIVGWQRD